MECIPSPLLTPATGRMRWPASGQTLRKHHKDDFNDRFPGTLIFEGAPNQHGLRPRVWLGSQWAARDPAWLEANHIGVVLPCTGFPLVRPAQQHPR